MRKLVIRDDKKTITLDEINNTSLVGIAFSSGNKTIIIKTNNGYVALDKDLDTTDSWDEVSVQKYVEEALVVGVNEVLVFNNTKEMFNWLAE